MVSGKAEILIISTLFSSLVIRTHISTWDLTWIVPFPSLLAGSVSCWKVQISNRITTFRNLIFINVKRTWKWIQGVMRWDWDMLLEYIISGSKFLLVRSRHRMASGSRLASEERRSRRRRSLTCRDSSRGVRGWCTCEWVQVDGWLSEYNSRTTCLVRCMRYLNRWEETRMAADKGREGRRQYSHEDGDNKWIVLCGHGSQGEGAVYGMDISM